MAKVVLLCGKICSGKSTYALRLSEGGRAVFLSCDELMLDLFDERLGDRHEETLRLVKEYLYALTVRIIETGTDVVLDFGFWSREERAQVRARFAGQGVKTELHYVKVSDAAWERNISKRNSAVLYGIVKGYFVDAQLKQMLAARFEEPEADKIDVVYECPNE